MYFLTFFPSFMADCWLFWILFHPTLAPDTGLMVVWFVWLFVPFLPISFWPEVLYPVVPLSVHLWTATAVFVIWRQIQWSDGIWWWLGGYLEAAGHGWGGIGLNFLGENGEKRVLSQKKNQGPHQWYVQNHHAGKSSKGGPWSRWDDHETEQLFGFPKLFSFWSNSYFK